MNFDFLEGLKQLLGGGQHQPQQTQQQMQDATTRQAVQGMQSNLQTNPLQQLFTGVSAGFQNFNQRDSERSAGKITDAQQQLNVMNAKHKLSDEAGQRISTPQGLSQETQKRLKNPTGYDIGPWQVGTTQHWDY